MKHIKKEGIVLIFSMVFLFSLFVPFSTHASIIQCGKAGQPMCTLCDLILGINNVILYIRDIAIGLGILAFTVGGVVYAISAGDKGIIDTAKSIMKNAVIGFLVIFGAWVIVNTTIMYLGTKDKTNKNGGTLGLEIQVTSWGNFTCTAKTSSVTSTKFAHSFATNKNCEMLSINVQNEKNSAQIITLSSIANNDKPNTYPLIAKGTYDCKNDATTIKNDTTNIKIEDITTSAIWTVEDESIAKVEGGNVQAVAKGQTTIKASHIDSSGKTITSDPVDIYVDLCPRGIDNCSVFEEEKESTCKFVYGNENADYIFILQRSECANLPSLDEFCQKDKKSWNSDSNAVDFDKYVTKLAEGLNLAPNGTQKFAIYQSYMIADTLNYDCPIGKFTGQYNLCYGIPEDGTLAFSSCREPDGSTSTGYFCSSESSNSLFAHEAIGHGFAGLDDEYVLSADYVTQDGFHLNCTSDKNCSKWSDISKDCFKGCDTTPDAYRSIDSGIMNNGDNALNFGKLNLKIIEATYENFPDLGLRNKLQEPNIWDKLLEQ